MVVEQSSDLENILQRFSLATRDAASAPDLANALVTPSIALSWWRCAQNGIPRNLPHPLPMTERDPLPSEDIIAQQLALVRPAMEDVYQFIEGTHSVVSYCDASGQLRDVIGDEDMLSALTEIGWTVGSCWSEECIGTNGVALALRDSFPTQISGPSHYCSILAPYTTSAAPVHDSLGGLIGALVVVTQFEQSQAHTLGMVSAAAGALTAELRMNLWLGNANELLSEMNAILHTLSEAILLLQADGTISQMNARAGHLLGLAPSRVSGRRLADVVEMPAALTQALLQGRELHDEEIIFHARGERVACMCTLRAIATPATLASSESASGAPTSLHVSPGVAASGFVLTLRSIERVHQLVHRMSGAQALMRFENIIGQSPQLLGAVRLARIAAESGSTVLLRGETGAGKEVFAQSIHNSGARANGPFVAINCAAIPRELISSELFGYEGGSFTGADRHGRPGKFELANGGTLFLDEIGDMPLDLQTSLLRAIESHTIVRVGGQHVTPVDVRIIAATHQDLAVRSQQGAFRSDLFFRLNVFPIEVPPLRSRAGDLPLLLRYILQGLSTRLNRTLGVEAEALAALSAYSWPGNVRELENVIERAVYICESGIIRLTDLPEDSRAPQEEIEIETVSVNQWGALGAAPHVDSASLPSSMSVVDDHTPLRYESASAEAALIQRMLRAHNGNISEAAAALGISRTTLWRKKQRYHLT